MLAAKKLSKKINYDVIDSLFIDHSVEHEKDILDSDIVERKAKRAKQVEHHSDEGEKELEAMPEDDDADAMEGWWD